MEDNLILEGLLSMVTELKEKLEAQVTPASREETLERFGAIEQASGCSCGEVADYPKST